MRARWLCLAIRVIRELAPMSLPLRWRVGTGVITLGGNRGGWWGDGTRGGSE